MLPSEYIQKATPLDLFLDLLFDKKMSEANDPEKNDPRNFRF